MKHIFILLNILLLYHFPGLGSKKLQVNQDQKMEYSSIDFFQNKKYLFGWIGPISHFGKGTSKTIHEIAQIQYENASIGQCRIICYPLDLKGWQLKVSKIYDETIEANEVMKITQDINLQKKFNIYAFFVEKKDLITEPDLEGKATHPKFPCTVTVYKKETTKWSLLKKEKVIDWNEYSDLIFKTSTAEKY